MEMIQFMGRLQKWDCYETYLLYEEYVLIQDNPLSFTIPDGDLITSDMMRVFLNAAYYATGKQVCLMES